MTGPAAQTDRGAPASRGAATPDAQGNAVRVAGLEADYDEVRAVRGIDFEVARGQLLTLLGPSGCGKTTTLRCIAGLHRVRAGSITINGTSVATAHTHVPAERRNLNMVFQSYAIWPHMTVFENVAYGLRAQRIDRRSVAARVADMLDLVGLGSHASRPATDLSGGQQQRVVLARALATRPSLLLLDEPLSNLDAQLRVQLRREIARVQKSTGTTAVYVTHDQAEALSMSDTVVLMRDGKVEQTGSPQELYRQPANLFAATFIGRTTRFDATVVEIRDSSVVLDVSAALGTSTLTGRKPPGQTLRRGERVDVVIRPEALSLAAAREATGPNAITGRIESHEFFGSYSELSVVSARTRLQVESRQALSAVPGELVELHVEPAQVMCVSRGGG